MADITLSLVGLDSVTRAPAAVDVINKAAFVLDGAIAMKTTVVGAVTYIAEAVPGTAQATAAWRVSKIDTTTGTVITWADGNSNFDNVATDLASLTYS